MRAALVTLLATLLLGGVAGSARAEELVPYEALGYRNGRALKLSVVTVGWAEVEVRTAKAFIAMRDAAGRDGIVLAIRSGWRSQERQRWLYEAWLAGWGNPAAKPGYSNHQSGRALDLYIDAPGVFRWLERNGRRFGFRRTVRGEPWHWEFTGTPKVKRRGSAARRRPSG